MGKKGDSDTAGTVPGGPLGSPEARAFDAGERGGPFQGDSHDPSKGDGKDLKRLERILERVSLELKEALEATGRDQGVPPPPMPSVVVHKIEAPEIFPTGGETGKTQDGEIPGVPEQEFTLEEDSEWGFYEEETKPEEPAPAPFKPFTFWKHPSPAKAGWILLAAGILLSFLGTAGLLLTWNGMRGIQGIRGKLEAQLQGVRVTGGLLEKAEKTAEEIRKLQSRMESKFAALSAQGKTLESDLSKAMAWMAAFEERSGKLEKAGADLKRALEEASRAREESRSTAALSSKALAEAETALSHLEELSSALAAFAEIRGVGEILRARLAGDRLRNRLASLGKKTWEPYCLARSPRNKPETGSFPDFERGRALPKGIRNVIDGQVMVLVPPGRMILGDEEGIGDPDERPEGQEKSRLAVEISRPFYMGRTEVTNAGYQKFVLSTGHTPPQYWGGKRCPKELLDFPVVCVSWEDATAYCEWAGLRLPTEAEWEYCAKSPLEGRSAGPWPWGKGAPSTSLANFDPTPPLRLKQKDWRFWLKPAGANGMGKTPWGLLQMAGNAAEWCRDWYRTTWYTTLSRRGGVIRDPQGPPFGLGKVIRGGSWCGTEREIRSTARQMASPHEKFTFLGFRCARDACTVR